LKRSNRLVLLVGALLAVVAFVGVVLLLNPNSNGSNGASPTPTAPTTANVVKATVSIAAGTTVTAEMVTLSTVPIGAVTVNSLQDTGLAIGQTVRRQVTAGAQLTADYFVDLGATTDVSQNLPAGLRAVSVQVDQITGVGTLIHTGDYVDVVIAVKWKVGTAQDPTLPGASPGVVPGAPVPDKEDRSVKMIIQSVKVVGTLLAPAVAPDATPNNGQPAASPTPTPVSQPVVTLNGGSEIVLLAVTADQAEAIRFAQLYGDPVELALRSPKDYVAVDANGSPIPGASPVTPPIEKTTGAILTTLISKWGVLPPAPFIGK
jgi:Flp pilus assembly protein CpaB